MSPFRPRRRIDFSRFRSSIRLTSAGASPRSSDRKKALISRGPKETVRSSPVSGRAIDDAAFPAVSYNRATRPGFRSGRLSALAMVESLPIRTPRSEGGGSPGWFDSMRATGVRLSAAASRLAAVRPGVEKGGDRRDCESRLLAGGRQASVGTAGVVTGFEKPAKRSRNGLKRTPSQAFPALRRIGATRQDRRKRRIFLGDGQRVLARTIVPLDLPMNRIAAAGVMPKVVLMDWRDRLRRPSLAVPLGNVSPQRPYWTGFYRSADEFRRGFPRRAGWGPPRSRVSRAVMKTQPERCASSNFEEASRYARKNRRCRRSGGSPLLLENRGP
jgi:hypothetical protein